MFADLDRCPDWLAAHEAAALAGYAPTDAGVARLVAELERREGEPTVYTPASRDLLDVRNATGAPLELATPRHTEERIERPLVSRATTVVHPILDLDLVATAKVCAETMGLPLEVIRAKTRGHAISSARAMSVFIWSSIGRRPAAIMAAYLGISEPAASQLRRFDSPALKRALPRLRVALDALGISAEHLDLCSPILDLALMG